MYDDLRLPKLTRFNAQRVYAAPVIIFKQATTTAKVLYSNKPKQIINSPIKLLVPGKLMFAIENIRKNVAKRGAVIMKPPKYSKDLTLYLW